jgi:hypothetical protein
MTTEMTVEELLAVLTDVEPIITRLAEQQRQERGGSMEGPECNTGEYLLHLRVKAALSRAEELRADTKADTAGFRSDEYSHTAKRLRSGNEAVIQAALSNNINIIIAALDHAAEELRSPPSAPHVNAALINALAEEGTRADLVEWLQITWNELYQLRGGGQGWRPIETAPKDRTEVLVSWRDSSHTRIAHFSGHGWTAQSGNNLKQPTHYMPLPPAPRSE